MSSKTIGLIPLAQMALTFRYKPWKEKYLYMSFKIDIQTYTDLGLFSHNTKTPSIFSFYNKTKTIGGKEFLFKLIQTPFSDVHFLENRKAEILSFYNIDPYLKLDKRQLDYIEFYLISRKMPLKDTLIDSMMDKMGNKLRPHSDYYTIQAGIIHLSTFLKDLEAFLEEMLAIPISATMQEKFESTLNFIQLQPLADFLKVAPGDYKNLKARHINRIDNFFRDTNSDELRKVLNTVYEIDVLQTFAILLETKQYSLPEYITTDDSVFEVIDFIHPLLEKPVKNSFSLNHNHSLCLITGPNMSGKSTFLKSMGLLTYLAHLGIPVPAKKMKTSIFNGLFTTINLPDNISLGFSHFYAEVNRVKVMAQALQENNNIVVVLDELFRGTNVKDAYDGTLMIMRALSQIKGSIFFISTHILEVAEQLREFKNVDFKCFESRVISDKPDYDYNLKDGITTERVGLHIIKNEGIEEILNSLIEKQQGQ